VQIYVYMFINMHNFFMTQSTKMYFHKTKTICFQVYSFYIISFLYVEQ